MITQKLPFLTRWHPASPPGSALAFNLPGDQPTLVKNYVLNLTSVRDYDPFLHWMKKWWTVGIAKLSPCLLRGHLGVPDTVSGSVVVACNSCYPALTSEIVCFHRYWNSAFPTPRCHLKFGSLAIWYGNFLYWLFEVESWNSVFWH